MDLSTKCNCHRCLEERDEKINGVPFAWCRMVVCPQCGDKRCPHAEDHRSPCSKPRQAPTQPSLSDHIRQLARRMRSVADDMIATEHPETISHAHELRGAANIAESWASEIERL
jgi:ribosome-binding protein aMBF1 (putative translation factor)